MGRGSPFTANATPMLRPAAWTRTSTSPSPISGLAISLVCRASNDPYLSCTIAFMATTSC